MKASPMRLREMSHGVFCEYPTLVLNKSEYAKIISEINSNYDLYRGKKIAFHSSVGEDNCFYMYYFENHGFNDYNIIDRFGF